MHDKRACVEGLRTEGSVQSISYGGKPVGLGHIVEPAGR